MTATEAGPAHQVPLMRPSMDEREVEAAGRAIRSGWVTQGPEVAAFETEFAAFTGAGHAAAVANCTAAIHLSLLAVGVGSGDEVITVSHSYVATANAVSYCDATPVFVDVDRLTHNIDVRQIDGYITAKTKAILVVHQMGMPCDMVAVNAIAKRHRLPVIEDAACAAGSEIQLRDRFEPVGRPHGTLACFSFHPRKVVSTGDGGMVTSDDEALIATIKKLRQHGMSVDARDRHNANQVVFESYPTIGYNYRMTDIQAAVGRVQLERLPDIVAERRRLADGYRERLADVELVTLPHEPEWAKTNWQSYAVGLAEHCDQRAVMQRLLNRGVASRRGIMNAHREIPHHRPEGSLPESEWCQDHTILIPLFNTMTEQDLDYVSQQLADALASVAKGELC